MTLRSLSLAADVVVAAATAWLLVVPSTAWAADFYTYYYAALVQEDYAVRYFIWSCLIFS